MLSLWLPPPSSALTDPKTPNSRECFTFNMAGEIQRRNPNWPRRLTFDKHVLLENLRLPESDVPEVENPIQLVFAIGEGRLTPNEWKELIDWIKAKKPELASHLDELDALRLEDSRPIQESGQRIIAEQWEATGAAMDFPRFERADFLPPLEKKILKRGKDRRRQAEIGAAAASQKKMCSVGSAIVILLRSFLLAGLALA